MQANLDQPVSQDIVHALGALLTDFLGMVTDDRHGSGQGRNGICSVKELRVLHTVLSHWRRNSPCTVTQIAGETGISKTTVSRCVSGMMESRLLVESTDPDDGRRRLLTPTVEGRQLLRNLDAWLGLWATRLADLCDDQTSTGSIEPRLSTATHGS